MDFSASSRFSSATSTSCSVSALSSPRRTHASNDTCWLYPMKNLYTLQGPVSQRVYELMIVKIDCFLAVSFTLMVQSGHKFVHVTTAELSCRDMCKIVVWSSHNFNKKTRCIFLRNLNCELKNLWWNGSLNINVEKPPVMVMQATSAYRWSVMEHVTLAAMPGTTRLVPYHWIKSQQLIWRLIYRQPSNELQWQDYILWYQAICTLSGHQDDIFWWFSLLLCV